MREGKNKELFEESGEVSYPGSDKLTTLCYHLLRDCTCAGALEEALREAETNCDEDITYTNGYLAKYAKHLADRIKKL
jgi:hypothetical protein